MPFRREGVQSRRRDAEDFIGFTLSLASNAEEDLKLVYSDQFGMQRISDCIPVRRAFWQA